MLQPNTHQRQTYENISIFNRTSIHTCLHSKTPKTQLVYCHKDYEIKSSRNSGFDPSYGLPKLHSLFQYWTSCLPLENDCLFFRFLGICNNFLYTST